MKFDFSFLLLQNLTKVSIWKKKERNSSHFLSTFPPFPTFFIVTACFSFVVTCFLFHCSLWILCLFPSPSSLLSFVFCHLSTFTLAYDVYFPTGKIGMKSGESDFIGNFCRKIVLPFQRTDKAP